MIVRWLAEALVGCLLLSLAACWTGKPDTEREVDTREKEEDLGPPWFEDITRASGIDFAYKNGEDTANHLSILESLGGGVGLIDYDGDGLLDVFLPGGGAFTGKDKKEIVGRPCRLYRNLGKGK